LTEVQQFLQKLLKM